MTPEQQNAAIAKVCGWHKHDCNDDLCWKFGEDRMGRTCSYYDLPSYTTDLNAMNEAEKMLNVNQEYTYGAALAQLVRDPEDKAFGELPEEWPFNGWGYFTLAHLTAAQKAETFLKVLGLWEDTK